MFRTPGSCEFALLHEPCLTTQCTTGQLPPAGLRTLDEVGLSADFYAIFSIVLDVIFATIWGAVATLIFWRRSDNRMGMFISFALLTFGTATFVFTMEALAVRHPVWEIPFHLLHFLGSVYFGLFLYLFPDGRFVPRWTRWVALVWIAWQLPRYLFPDWYLNSDSWYPSASLVVWLVAFGTTVYSQVHRYRRISNATQRQQIKWVVFGIAAALTGYLGTALALTAFVPSLTSPHALIAHLAGYAIMYAAMLLIPLSISVAILRYQLFDIDLIINRTLVYDALTASVVLLYVLVVGGLGAVLRLQGSLIVSLIATGLAAVMFQPFRDRLQRAVNRLMYGERHEPYAVLSRLGKRLEASLAPDAVLPAAVRTVAETLKLAYVAVEAGKDGALETVAVTGEPVRNPLRLPLVYGGETARSLILAPRAGEESFSAVDRRLLEDLAHQIGVAAHAARLTEEAVRLSADLQKSRERLVNTREEERRRLRRDLHDGLGPQLASLTMKAEAARDLIAVDPMRAGTLLSSLIDQTQSAVADVRRLVYALRPPALDALGLVGAIRSHASHLDHGGPRVRVEAPEKLPALPAAVEVAAYRISLEAVNNAARHSGAKDCIVRLVPGMEDGTLRLEVQDDGRGIGEDRGSGIGLASMRERAGELGGWCTVEAVPSGGTLVKASLPALDVTEETASPDHRRA